MDKKYYYRMLGLTGEPTQAQIKRAYEQRVAKLHAPDYRDDPEYAKKKMAEANMAYKVLTGSSPVMAKGRKQSGFGSGTGNKPSGRGGRKVGFERFKDALESGEDNERKQVFAGSIGGAAERAKRFENPAVQSQRRAGKLIVVAITVFFIFMGVVGGLIDSLTDGWEPREEIAIIDDDERRAIDEAQMLALSFDYYEMLDRSTIDANFDSVDWKMGAGEFGEGELFENSMWLLSMLSIDDAEVFFNYTTGIDDYFYEYDDQDCAASLIVWMAAPQFEEVAGATNLYTNEPILNQSDYLEYLGTVIYENQQN